MIERLFDTEAALVAALAGDIAERLTRAVEARGLASLVATGGATPGPLYDALSALPAPWNRTWITLSDERWVDPADAASNERLVRAGLIRGCAGDAHFVPLKTDDAAPSDAVEAVDARLAAMPRPFDVVVLGVGADGHFASLFPGAEGLAEALQPFGAANVVAVDAAGAAGASARLSLTLSCVLDARLVVLLIRGEEKLALVRGALDGDLPVRAVIDQARTPVEVYWAP